MPKVLETKKEYAHVCGQCGGGFNTDAEYCAHKCVKTGFKPTELGHHGEAGKAISEAALKRGAERKATEEAEAAEKK
jgi:uncharacterized OB-fold protein